MAKVTKKTAFVGALGLACLGFAAFRRPRYLMDGVVEACEGGEGTNCTSVSLKRSGGTTGELKSPFSGTVASMTPTAIMIASDNEPILYGVEFVGKTSLQPGQKVKFGELIGRAESAKVKFFRVTRASGLEVISPSAWVAVNGLQLVKTPGGLWCESKKVLNVPRCEKGQSGYMDNFASPRMPRWSLKTVQLSI